MAKVILKAFDADTGKVPVGTVNGKQYIAIMTGEG
jgi:hypothetical protein